MVLKNDLFSSEENGDSISLPNNLKTIGDFAFLGCSRILTIVIPRSVEKIGANAFMSCPMLNSAVVLNKETDIDGAFSDRVNIIRV